METIDTILLGILIIAVVLRIVYGYITVGIGTKSWTSKRDLIIMTVAVIIGMALILLVPNNRITYYLGYVVMFGALIWQFLRSTAESFQDNDK